MSPGDVLHHQEERGVVLAYLEDLADVGVIDRSHRHRFAAQALARGRVGGRLRRQQLDRYLTIERGVVGAVHLAHAARADRREDLVAAETRAWCERQQRQRSNSSANGVVRRGRVLLDFRA